MWRPPGCGGPCQLPSLPSPKSGHDDSLRIQPYISVNTHNQTYVHTYGLYLVPASAQRLV